MHFDVIKGGLPFLICLPTLVAMRANLSLNVKWLGIRTDDQYVKLMLRTNDGHIFLPFRSEPKRDDRRKYADNNKSSYYSSHGYNCETNREDSDTRETVHPTEHRELEAFDSGGSVADAYAEHDLITDHSDEEYPTDTSDDQRHPHDHFYHTTPHADPATYDDGNNARLATTIGSQSAATTEHDSDEYSEVHYVANSRPSRELTMIELRKVHLHLKHASVTQLDDYFRIANVWTTGLKKRSNESCSHAYVDWAKHRPHTQSPAHPYRAQNDNHTSPLMSSPSQVCLSRTAWTTVRNGQKYHTYKTALWTNM